MTIVVLLILAGISINIMVGEDGIIGKASKAKIKQVKHYKMNYQD